MSTSAARISVWGKHLAVRLTKSQAEEAGIAAGSPVRVTIERGRIVIEIQPEPTLEQMLAAFNPGKHSGEVMADRALGVEAFADGRT